MNIIRLEYTDSNKNKLVVIRERSFRKEKSVNTADLVIKALKSQFHCDKIPNEEFYAVYCDNKMVPKSCLKLGMGSSNKAIFGEKFLFSAGLLTGSEGFFIVHNHPSGDPSPSKEDINTTEKIKSAGDMIGIYLIDHIIIGDNKYYSFVENKLI